MNVLLVHNFYRSFHVGGEDVVFKRTRRALAHQLPGALETYTVNNDDVSSVQAARSLFEDKHARHIGRLVAEKEIDVVHVHNYFPLLTPQIFRYAKESGAKVVCQTLHNYRRWCMAGTFFRDGRSCDDCIKSKSPWPGIRHRCFQGKYSASLMAGMAMRMYENRHDFDALDRIFYLSNTQGERLRGLGVPDEKLCYLPNSLPDVQDVAQAPKTGFVYVGRLEQSKGIFHLLKVWRTLPETTKLTVIGTSPDMAAIRARYASKNIEFLGRCPETATMQLISGAKFLIQPSLLEETFGLTILEAMSCGTPVIGFPVGTRRELIDHGKTGYITELGDLAETVRMCDRMQADAYRALSDHARAFARHFSEESVTAQCITYYKEAILAGTKAHAHAD